VLALKQEVLYSVFKSLKTVDKLLQVYSIQRLATWLFFVWVGSIDL
jgi:hypothetical protein